MLTHDRLIELHTYDPLTGILTRRKTGKAVGSRMARGYLMATIDRRGYLVHRLAWLYVHGKWPGKWLDHKNRVRHDNRIDNLREASPYENVGNRETWTAHGFKGATPSKGRWQAQIKKDGKNHYIGLFDTPEEARSAYLVKAREFFGEFAS